MDKEIISSIILAMGIPSLIAGLGIWRIKKVIEHAEVKRERKERALCEYQNFLLKGTLAAINLSEETIKAIRDKKTNGTVDKALEYANTVKKEQKEFMLKMGIENIYS